jgi:hypothetical protein
VRRDIQHQKPQAPQTDGKASGTPCSSICHNRKFRNQGLSVQAHSSTNNDTLKAATVMQQIITELSEDVSKEDKITVITKMILNLMKQNGC